MTCAELRDHLSAYYDGELREPLRTQVEQHVADCDACQNDLESFRQLSALSAQMRNVHPPSGMWEQFERQLTASEQVSRSNIRWRYRLAAVAALILMAAGLVVARFLPERHDHAAQNATMAAFLHEFARDPLLAQRRLVNEYQGQPIDAKDAVADLNYTPVAARGAPPGYRLASSYVVKMPCCKCVQTIFTRDSGGAVAVFEHNEDQPDWFGSRPSIHAKCNGNDTTLVEVGDGLAATWNMGNRCITVVGAKDVAEVSQLMTALEQLATDEERPPTDSPSRA